MWKIWKCETCVDVGNVEMKYKFLMPARPLPFGRVQYSIRERLVYMLHIAIWYQ
jgi:hypothetical protein